MLGSLFGFFLPELINALWTKNRTAYWLLFIGSMISFMLFIILAFQYVDRWHNIIDTLRCKNASLYKTVSLYAVMSKSESVGHVNETVKVNKIVVTYQFREKSFTDPIYQFRTFFVLNRAKTVLYNMADEAKQEKMRTIDGREIDSEMVQYIWRSALEMVESFEAHFDETYYDERTTEEKLQQTYHFENQSRPASAEKLSYLMPIYLDRAAKEAKAIQNTWPELKNNLQKCTPCFPLYDKIG